MATYIPGVQSYMPDMKPFTPDYQFLGNILDVKTNRYNTNYKAINDLYSKVVYGDLSRSDTSEMRNHFAETVAPQLQKVSGMDLSVMQNAEAARAIFKPFFEEDIIVKDLVTTKQYIDQMGMANRLQNSPSQEMRDRYWDVGVKKMQYEMEDFVNASPEQALTMAAPTYTPNANLFERGKAFLEAQGYDVKIDYVDPANPQWVVTEKNGNLITKQAIFDMQNALVDDPLVRNAYYADSFVRSRDFAKQGMDAGQFASVQDGQATWATQTINNYEQLLAAQNVMLEDQASKDKSVLVSWDTYSKQQGVIPGSKEEEEMKEASYRYDYTTKTLEKNREVLGDSNINTSDVNSLLNRAYNIVMQTNINKDLMAAATAFASTHREYSIKQNENYADQLDRAHDFEKIRRKGIIDMYIKQMEIDAEGGGPGVNQLYLESFNPKVKPSDAELTIAPLGSMADKTFVVNQDYLDSEIGKNLDEGVDKALSIYMRLYPNAQNNYTLSGMGISGTPQQIKEELLKKPNEAAKFIRKMISETTKGGGTTYRTIDGDAIGPGLSANKEFQDLVVGLQDVDSKLGQVEYLDKEAHKIYSNNWNKFLTMGDNRKGGDQFLQAKRIAALLAQGVPNVLQQNANGDPDEISFAEFANQFQTWVKGKMETNPYFLSYFDAQGLNGSGVKPVKDEILSTSPTTMIGVPGSFRKRTDPASRQRVHNKRYLAKKEKGNLIYDLYRGMMDAYLNVQDGKYNPPGKAPIFEVYNAQQAVQGIPADQMTTAQGMFQGNVFESTFDPAAPTKNPQAIKNNMSFFSQFNNRSMKSGYNVDFIRESGKMAGNPQIAEEVLQEAVLAIERKLRDPKTKGKTPNLQIHYITRTDGAKVGMPGKNTASYKIRYNKEWGDAITKAVAEKSKAPAFIHGADMVNFNEIIFSFDRNSDVNPFRMENINNFSMTLDKLENSPNDQFKTEIPQGGAYSVYKNQRGEIMMDLNGVVWDMNKKDYTNTQTQTFNLSTMKALEDQAKGIPSNNGWYDAYLRNIQVGLNEAALQNEALLRSKKQQVK